MKHFPVEITKKSNIKIGIVRIRLLETEIFDTILQKKRIEVLKLYLIIKVFQ